MATPTYELIETTTLTSSASSVTFSSITQDYRDLVMVIEIGGTDVQVSPLMRFNSDSGSNYSRVQMIGNGTSATSGAFTGQTYILGSGVDADGGTADKGFTIHQIMDYSATDKHTTVLTRGNNPSVSTLAVAQRWANTAAITQVDIVSNYSTFTAGSVFSLYGIAS